MIVDPFEHVTALLEARGFRRGERYVCPAHDDRHPSLSIGHGDNDCVLLHCFAGCDIGAIARALGLDVRDLFPTRARVRMKTLTSTATPQHPAVGCTVAAYAERKKLPVEYLLGLGLADTTSRVAPAISIPYTDPTGDEVSMRFRHTMEGDRRFSWRRGSKPCLYGLSRIGAARAAGTEITLVEGESDCHTL